MSFNVYELDNRVEEYLSSGIQDAEEWRLQKAALSARDRTARVKLLGQVAAGAMRAAVVIGLLVGGIRQWLAGSSEPQEEYSGFTSAPASSTKGPLSSVSLEAQKSNVSKAME